MQDKSVVYHQSHTSQYSIPIPKVQYQALINMQPSLLAHHLAKIIYSLNKEQRDYFTKIWTPELADVLRTCYIGNQHQRQNTGKLPIAIQQKISDPTNKKDFKRQGQEQQAQKVHCLFSSLIFVSQGRQYLESICFEPSLLQVPQKLTDLLISNIPNPHSLPMRMALKSNLRPQSFASHIQKCNSKWEVQNHLVHYLREQILLRLREGTIEGEVHMTQIEEDKVLKKQFYNYWRNLSQQQKKKLLLLDCKDISGLLCHLGKRSQLTEQQMSKQIDFLLKMGKNQFCDRIFKCQMKDIQHAFFQYHRQVYNLWRKQVETARRKRMIRSREERDYNSERKGEAKRKGKKRKTISLQSNQTNQTQGQLGDIGSRSPQNHKKESKRQTKPQLYQHMMERSQQQRKQKREMTCSVQRQQRSTRNIKIKQKNQKQKLFKQRQYRQHEYEKNPQQLKEQSRTKQESVSSKTTFSSRKSKEKSQNIKIQHQYKAIKHTTYLKLAQQLYQLSDHISQEANQYYQRRIIAFQRIQFLLQFYSIPIKLFGSCANGIAVKNSDIDIAIDQSILSWMEVIPDNQKVRLALERLQEIFQQHQCITQIKLIKTAAVPVMKLNIDTSLLFISPDFYSLNRPHNCGPIQADITIQTPSFQHQCSSHLGILTTRAISQWLTHLKPLHTIVIVMKQFFALNHLNLSYQGGLNTISMIVMFVAYIIRFGLQNQENSAYVLEKILSFYVEEFDQKIYGIDIWGDQGIYYRKEDYPQQKLKLMKADLQIRDPISRGKNMTRNSYLYPQIKQMFKTILQQCFTKRHKQFQEILQKQEQLNLQELYNTNFKDKNEFMKLHAKMQHKN